MIKTVVFDLGGVIINIDQNKAVRRFEEIGVTDASELLDPYTQSGFFGDLEAGKISDEDFRRMLSAHVGKELTWEQCCYAWRGYENGVPHRNLEYLEKLRREGYRVILLSNTNPFMMSWAESDEFSGDGHPLSFYFDAEYKSFEVRLMKPDEQFFLLVLSREKLLPSETLYIDDGPRNCAAAAKLGILTYCPTNGSDWRPQVDAILKEQSKRI